MHKACSKCDEWKDISDFYDNQLWCKTCLSTYARAKNGPTKPRKIPDIDGKRICYSCNQIKLLEEFTKNKSCYNGYERKCKICTNQCRKKPEQIENLKKLQKEWYKDNKEKVKMRQQIRYEANKEEIKAYARKHHQENPGSILAANQRRRERVESNGNNDLTASQINDLYTTQKTCVYCGIEDKLTIDHIIPISKGGQNTLSNVALACWTCNNKKRTNLWTT